MASMAYGTALGWPSPVLVKMAQQEVPIHLSPDQVSWMVSMVYVTNLLSPLPAGVLMDKVGRKWALILLTIPAVAAWPITLLANDVTWLYVARLLVGIQGGASTTIAPTYIAEMAQAKYRGGMSTAGMFFCFVGIFYSYFWGHFVSYELLCFLNGIIPLAFIVLFSMLPDTPYWYIMEGRRENAEQALSWLRCCSTEHIQDELARIESGVKQQMADDRTGFKQLLVPTNRRALIIVLAVTFAQRMTGFGSLLVFGSTALPDLGWISAEQCNMAVGAVWMLSILLAGYLLDEFGRKPLVILSSLGTFLSMTIIGLYFLSATYQPHLTLPFKWVPFVFTLIFSLLFATGVGPVALLLPSELFPANIKAKASAIASISQAASAFLSSIIWLDVVDNFGLYFNYFTFAAVSLALFIFSVFYFIETKGKTLEQIQVELNKEQQLRSA